MVTLVGASAIRLAVGTAVLSVRTVAVARSRVVRGVYLALGFICLGFAYMSWLPGIPTFDFVILAAFFFARSSPRFENWLRNHRVFGRIIRGWQAREGFSVRTKSVASAAIIVSLGASIITVDSTVLKIVLGLVGVYAVWFVWSRPTKRNRSAEQVQPLT